MNIPATTAGRHGKRPLSAVLLVIMAAASCSSSADPADYFEAIEASQAAADEAIGELFSSPVALQVEPLLEDERALDFDAEQDALVRTFVIEFWTGAFKAMASHRDDMADISVPGSVHGDHHAYADAIDALLETEDALLANAEASTGAELIGGFWDSTPEIEAVDTTCRALVASAATEGIVLRSPICEE